jgi:glycerate kinase
VDNPFIGPKGAARVFAPQKGADSVMVERLERRMALEARRIREVTGIDVSGLPGGGAAGGLAGALAAWFGASLSPGIDTVLKYLDFESKAGGADWILTGEGRSDRQTLSGKVPLGVLRHAGLTPVALLSGRIRDREALAEAGFASLVEVTPSEQPLSEALRPDVAEMNLRAAAARWLTLLRP